MTELRFSRAIYVGEAIDEAIQAFSRFARFEQAMTDEHFVVSVSCQRPEHARRVVGEFCNYCLGATLQREGGPAGAGEGAR